jgi:hypothetical protein
LLFTGLYWERDRPTLTGLVGSRQHARPVELGQALGWEIAGPRRCIGLYDREEHRRRPCIAGSLVIEGSQCDVCQRADPGRLVARGQTPSGFENEVFVLYLAWFGDELHKVGITAEERGAERLCEQGALSYCLFARGPFNSVRRAEVLLAGIGVAPERITMRTKQAAWWRIPQAEERAEELAALHRAASEALRSVRDIEMLKFEGVDLTPQFGLEQAMASRYEFVTAIRPGAVLSGELSHVIGRCLVLGPAPMVIDTRLLEGWTLRRSSQPVGGLEAETRSREADARAVQGTLF